MLRRIAIAVCWSGLIFVPASIPCAAQETILVETDASNATDSVVATDADAKTFGQAQLEQVIRDRRPMRGVVAPENPMVQWVIDQFESGDQGRRVLWDHSPTFSKQPAECIPSQGPHTAPAVVRIGDNITNGRDLWCLLVFELENLKRNEGMLDLFRRAHEGDLDQDGFVSGYMELEHETLLKTGQRLHQWNPFTGANIGDQERWLTSIPEDFDQYAEQMQADPETNYRKYIEREFIRASAATRAKDN